MQPASTSLNSRASRVLAPALLALLTGLAACGKQTSSSEASSGAAGLVILNPTAERAYFHDFGSIPHGEVVRHTFRLENSDPVAVSVGDLLPSCSCSQPTISYIDADGQRIQGDRQGKPVIVLPPGAVAEVQIAIDSQYVRLKNMDKLAQVRLRCDSLNTPFITFEMHLIVELEFQATPAELNLGSVPMSSGARATSDIIRGVPGSGLAIEGVLTKSPGLEVTVSPQSRFGKELWVVEAILLPPLNPGPWQGEIELATRGPEGPARSFKIPLRAQIVADIVVQPATLGFSPFSPARGATATAQLLSLVPGRRIKILSAEIKGSLPPGLELGFEAIQVDNLGRAERWGLILKAPPSYPRQRVLGQLVFELDDPDQPRVEVPFIFTGV